MILVAVLKISTKWGGGGGGDSITGGGGGVYSNVRGLVEFKWFLLKHVLFFRFSAYRHV